MVVIVVCVGGWGVGPLPVSQPHSEWALLARLSCAPPQAPKALWQHCPSSPLRSPVRWQSACIEGPQNKWQIIPANSSDQPVSSSNCKAGSNCRAGKKEGVCRGAIAMLPLPHL